MKTRIWSSCSLNSAWIWHTTRDKAWVLWEIDVYQLRAFSRATVSETESIGNANLSFQQSRIEILVQAHQSAARQCHHGKQKYLNAHAPSRYATFPDWFREAPPNSKMAYRPLRNEAFQELLKEKTNRAPY